MHEPIIEKARLGQKLTESDLKVLMTHMLEVLQSVLQASRQAHRNAGIV